MADLKCYSYHSVKGGVGKTTLATLTALYFSQCQRLRTLLVDMDLTGTSLADVFPLEAPSWETPDRLSTLPLHTEPTSFYDAAASRKLMADRHESRKGSVGVPLLNDFLLYADRRFDPSADVHPKAIAWRYQTDVTRGQSYDQLWIAPSSALPADLYRLMPLIFDEPYAGFLEGRLEWLLHRILELDCFDVVVFDTPPTIPGLSRSVLSLGLRLPRLPDPYAELSQDGGTPPLLLERKITWTPCMVTTGDLQDLRAVSRWYEEASSDEQCQIRMIVNKLPNQASLEDRARALNNLSPESSIILTPPFLERAIPITISEEKAFNLFLDGAIEHQACNRLESIISQL